MISENIFEMAQFDNSSYKLLWRNPVNPIFNAASGMTFGTINFDRGDYPLLLVVCRRIYYGGSSENDWMRSSSFAIVENRIDGTPYILGGDPQVHELRRNYQGFYRLAGIVDEGLSVSDCRWRYGTYDGSLTPNSFVIPTMIYGIR